MRASSLVAPFGVALVIVGACTSFSSSNDGPADASNDVADGGSSSDAPAVDAPSTCGDVTSDPHNCGACGHDCLGGACAKSVCQPVLIANVSDGPIGDIALDAEHLLWMTGGESGEPGSLRACPKRGCAGAPPTVLAQEVPTASLSSDGTTAYATFVNGTAKTIRIEPTLSTTPFENAHTFARVRAQAEGVFVFAYHEPDGGGYARTLYRENGTSTETAEAIYDGTNPPGTNAEQFVVTADHVYLGSHSQDLVFACTRNGCRSWTTLTNATNVLVESMTRDATQLFWTSYGTLHSCSLDASSCAPGNVLPRTDVREVTFGAGLLVMTTNAGDLLTCDSTNCAGTVKMVAHENALDVQLALYTHNATADAVAIYYSAVDRSTDGGADAWRLMMVAR